MRKDLRKHMMGECPNRDYHCENCGKEGKYAYITQSHDKRCPKKVINCCNSECQDAVQRQRLKRHLEVCAFTLIPCKYVKLGCQTKKKRVDMPIHEVDDKCHIIMALDSVVKLQEENVNLKEKLLELESITQYTFMLTEYDSKINECDVFSSPSFYTINPAGYHLSIDVFVYASYNSDDGSVFEDEDQNTCLSVSINFVKGRNDHQLNWPFTGYVTITLLNQLGSEGHFKKAIHFEAIDNTIVGSTLKYDDFIPISRLGLNTAENTQYLKDDTLHFSVSTCMHASIAN